MYSASNTNRPQAAVAHVLRAPGSGPGRIRTGALVSPGKGHSRIRPMEGRVDLETRGRQRVLQSHRLEGFGAGRGDVRQMPCAFEAVLQVYAGERCGQLAQI